MSRKHRSSKDSDETFQYVYTERIHWSSKIDFLLSSLGFAVGLGNVWRFPTLAYKNGGGAFLIPYLICLFAIGMPVFFLELALGQFTSCGPTTCWEYCPIVSGVGVGMAVVSALTSIYYNMIIAWALYFFFASFHTEVPWKFCDSEWSTEDCMDGNYDDFLDEKCRDLGGNRADEKCIVNGTEQKYTGTPVFPATQYFTTNVLGITAENDIENIGGIQYKLALCLLLAWITVALCLIRGVKSSGKVVYVTATVPYLMLTVLLIRGLMLEGSSKGIEYYMTPVLEPIKNADIWRTAATQIFFSLSAAYGGQIALSSYNEFSNNIASDALVVGIGNSITSIFAGFVIFSFLGSLSHDLHLPIDTVAASGPTLVFGIYPTSLTHLPGTFFWSIIFFLMLVLLGIDSEIVLVESVVTSIVDSFKSCRKHKMKVLFIVCTVGFIIGLPLTTPGGVHVLDLMDKYAGSWNLLLMGFIECISIGWAYGADRFLNDIDLMCGKRFCHCFRMNKVWRISWIACWKVLTPALCMFVCLFSWAEYKASEKAWVEVVGMVISLGGLFVGLFIAAYHVWDAEGDTFLKKLKKSTQATRYWGPADINDRRRVQKYCPDMILAPLGELQPGYRQGLEDEQKSATTEDPKPANEKQQQQ